MLPNLLISIEFSHRVSEPIASSIKRQCSVGSEWYRTANDGRDRLELFIHPPLAYTKVDDVDVNNDVNRETAQMIKRLDGVDGSVF